VERKANDGEAVYHYARHASFPVPARPLGKEHEVPVHSKAKEAVDYSTPSPPFASCI
jgi:hypothetical protein